MYIYFQKLNAEKTGVFNTCPAHLYFEQLPLCFYVYILSAEWRQMRSSLPNPELARLATSNLPRLLLGSKSTSTANKQYTAAWSHQVCLRCPYHHIIFAFSDTCSLYRPLRQASASVPRAIFFRNRKHTMRRAFNV